MIQAVIFDMDGLLIDSEPLWKKAEVEVFSSVGVPITIEMTDKTMGTRTDEVVEYWHKRYPWKTRTLKEVGDELDDRVLELVRKEGVARPGVDHAISICEALKLPMAIASSSSLTMIEVVMERLGITAKIKIAHSAHHEDFGKPHPAVYISTAAQLGIPPMDCLALEDSFNGVLSAKAAKMKCIAVPEKASFKDKRFNIADKTISTLNDLTIDTIKKLF